MTQSPEAPLRHIAEHLAACGARWALVGGLAVAARAEPRLTRDTDVAVSVTGDAEAEALISGLQGAGYRLVAVVEHGPSGRMATARLENTVVRGGLTDLLFSSCGIEPEIVAAADTIGVLPGLSVPVASRAHLIAMKLLARDDRHRPTDYDDLHALAAVADAGDWPQAGEAVALIHEREFDRGRDLVGALRELAAEHGVVLD